MARQLRFLRFAAGVDYKDVNRELLSRLNRLGASLGKVIEVVSGYRTRQKQAELYARYVHSGYDPRYIAARPGQSNHERGLAVDAEIDGKGIAQVVSARTMARFGLANPVKGDSPHTELANKSAAPTQAPQPSDQTAQQPAAPVAQATTPDITNVPAPVPDLGGTPPLLAPGSVKAQDFAPRQIAELWNLVKQQPNVSPDTLSYAQMAQQAAGG